nr:MAG TPA: hypothetical protein [Caudoviricetes sp.]
MFANKDIIFSDMAQSPFDDILFSGYKCIYYYTPLCKKSQ